MKRGLMFVGFIVMGLFMLSFVSAQDTCESLGYECGTWDIVDVIGPLNCGDCTDGQCIVGECYDFNELGECIFFGLDSSFCSTLDYDDCVWWECVWENNECKNPLCSDLKSECYDNNHCEWKNKEIYTTRLYWKGSGISNLGGFGGDDTFIIDEEMLENIEDTGISLIMILENSKLPEGTEINFEVASINRLTKVGEEMDEVKVHEIISSIVDKDGNAEVSWVIFEEDIEGYDGRKAFFFTIKKNGEVIIENSAHTNIYGTVVAIHPEIRELVFFTKKGECEGTISCETFSDSKLICEEIADEGGNCGWIEETDSCEGMGISCNDLGREDECESYDQCAWKPDSFWVIFTSWLKDLFGF